MNFGGDGERGDIVILSGTAHVDESGPNAVEDAAFVVKYATALASLSGFASPRSTGVECPGAEMSQLGGGTSR